MAKSKTKLRELSAAPSLFTESQSIEAMDITPEQLALINKQTITEFKAEQLFVFSVLLIDDSVTRNSTHYPESFQRTILSKEPRKGNWIGLTMLMGQNEDHETKASNQVARIFNAKLVKTPGGNIGTLAEAYIPVNKANEGFIDAIKAGIHREVSIGVAVERPTCSVCSEDVRECEHVPGHIYDGKEAYVTMQGDAEAQEVSFVAVPGNYNAQILSNTNEYLPLSEAFGKSSLKKEATDMPKSKAFKEELEGLKNLMKLMEAKVKEAEDEEDDEAPEDTEDDDVTVSEPEDDNLDEDEDEDDDDNNNGVPDDEEEEESDDDEEDELQTEALRAVTKQVIKMNEKLMKLEEQAKNGRQYHRETLKETLRLGVLAKVIPVQSKETFKKTFEKLTLAELQEFKKGYQKEVERQYPSTGKAIALTENLEESKQIKPASIEDIVAEFKR